MDAPTLTSFLPDLHRYLARFAHCFSDHRSRDHLPLDLRGQLSDLDRKSVEPMARAAGVAPRTLQEFLSSLSWHHAGLPGTPRHLLVMRHVLEGENVKYFLADAPEATATATLMWVALSRHRVERCFQDQKSELGLAHFEGRTYTGLMRHLYLTLVSGLFLMRVTMARRGENPEWTVPQVHRVVAAQIAAKWLGGRVSEKLLEKLADDVEYHQQRNSQARKSHDKSTRRRLRDQGIRLTHMPRCQPPD